MATQLQICNNGILLLGATPIASISDSSTEAVLCSNMWEQSKNAVLRIHPWNFAIKRALLATPDVPAPAYEWLASFTLPTDLLRLLEVNGITKYKVEGRKVLCDEASLAIRYVFKNDTFSDWDALFIEAMSAYMAFKLAYPLTKSNTTKKDMWDLFTEMLRTAKAIDAQEEPGDTIGEFPFLNVRG